MIAAPARVVRSDNGERHFNPRYVEHLENENARLRRALDEIAAVPEWWQGRVARKALDA